MTCVGVGGQEFHVDGLVELNRMGRGGRKEGREGGREGGMKGGRGIKSCSRTPFSIFLKSQFLSLPSSLPPSLIPSLDQYAHTFPPSLPPSLPP